MPNLTDTAIRNTKPAADPIKLFDAGGLYLLINPTGSRLWRMKYRVHGREKTLSFGPYPDLSLRAARTCAMTRSGSCAPASIHRCRRS